jgi:hypothetical protein
MRSRALEVCTAFRVHVTVRERAYSRAMSEKLLSVLFPCTDGSARSIMAEAIPNRAGDAHFRAYSAGSQLKSKVHV